MLPLLLGLTWQLLSSFQQIPQDAPTMEDLPSQAIFRRIGTVNPVLNYVLIRTTVHLSTLDAMAEQI